HDARFAAVWIELQLNSIPDQDLYPVQTHLAREIREYGFLTTFELHAELSIRKRLIDDSLNNFRFRHMCAVKNSKISRLSQGLGPHLAAGALTVTLMAEAVGKICDQNGSIRAFAS